MRLTANRKRIKSGRWSIKSCSNIQCYENVPVCSHCNVDNQRNTETVISATLAIVQSKCLDRARSLPEDWSSVQWSREAHPFDRPGSKVGRRPRRRQRTQLTLCWFVWLSPVFASPALLYIARTTRPPWVRSMLASANSCVCRRQSGRKTIPNRPELLRMECRNHLPWLIAW